MESMLLNSVQKMAKLFIYAYLGRRGRQKCLKMSIRNMNGPIGIIFSRLKEKKMLPYKSKQHIGDSGSMEENPNKFEFQSACLTQWV